MAVDLHVHTNISDGMNTPEEVVQQALQVPLEAVAITDHDAIAGIAMAQAMAVGKDIEIIPGIELSAESKHGDIHILGYYIETTSDELLNYISLQQNARKERIIKIVDKLYNLGIELDINEIIKTAADASVCRPHVARAIIASGAARTNKEVFNRYLGAGKPAYVPLGTLDPIQAIKLILAAKGVPVLAHPGCGKNSTTFINELIAAGLKGIEVYHPDHKLKQIKLYTKIAKKNNLIITGGSDFHGVKDGYYNSIGSFSVGYTAVEELKKLSSVIARNS